MKHSLINLAVLTLIFSGCATNNTVKYDESNNMGDTTHVTNTNYSDFVDELALHDAVRARDLNVVKFLIQQKSELNVKDIYGYTPLHIAVRLNEYEIAKELIANGANVNTLDNYKDTPLLDSTRNNYTKLSQLLICNGASRNIVDTHDMSPLHNSAKNKNLYISKMLRATDLTPYCSTLGVSIINLDVVTEGYKVCGNYTNSIEPTSKLSVADSEDQEIGNFDTEEKWCSTITTPLNNTTYKLKINANDQLDRNATNSALLNIDDDIKELYTENFKIGINNIDTINTNTTKICGDIKIGKAETINVMLTDKNTKKQYGSYSTIIEDDQWCTKEIENLIPGEYQVKANGLDTNQLTSVAIDDMAKVTVPAAEEVVVTTEEPKASLVGLYDALINEFQDDLKNWNAELSQDDLTFRFNNPLALFESGKKDLKAGFTDILSNFFPRYLKIIEQYKNEIQEIRIEGHTSSEYKFAKNDQERYEMNKKLSLARATETRNYALETASQENTIDNEWIENTFKPYGMAYDQLILNPDGSENIDASRRVEFKIVKITQ